MNSSKEKSLLFGITAIIGLQILSGLLNYFQVYYLWFTIIGYFIYLSLLLLLILNQIETLPFYNIDSFSLILFILFLNKERYKYISADSQTLLNILILIMFILFIVLFFKKKNRQIQSLSLKQVYVFLIGLFIGIGIAIIKILLNHYPYLQLAIDNPIQYIYSIFLSFSLYMLRTEFICRGFLWGYLKLKGINENWIILITAVLSVAMQFHASPNVPEMINFFILFLILGFLVKITKSLNISIGAIAGYSSFLILHLGLIQP